MISDVESQALLDHKNNSATPGFDFGFSTLCFLGPSSNLFTGRPGSLISVLLFLLVCPFFQDLVYDLDCDKG